MIIMLLYLLDSQILKSDAASCEGSVTFHWRKARDHRETNMENWKTMHTKITGNRSKLSVLIDTKTAYGFTLIGNCCWEVYPENYFKGEPVKLIPKLPNGFGGIPGYPKFHANSLKIISC